MIFSGAMVPLGLFGFAKLLVQVFAGSPDVLALVHGLLMGLGCATAAVGGIMAWSQRHLKRLLAFSTIAHCGIMLSGVAALSPIGLAGFLAYLVGHGLVKGSLFMLVGVLLASKSSLDELDLRGLGRDIWPAGVATAAAALLLGGAPLGILHGGAELIGASAPSGVAAAVHAAVLLGTALTGAAVLRATGRIYLGLGPDPGDEADAPSDEEQERANRPLWLMLAPVVVLLSPVVLVPADAAQRLAALWVPQFDLRPGPSTLPETDAWNLAEPWLALLGTIGTAAFALWREMLPRAWPLATDRLFGPVIARLNGLHSGLVSDYVVWMALGLALLAAIAAL